MNQELKHVPVFLAEVLEFLPDFEEGKVLDVTAGGGGHFFKILERKVAWQGECWDRDPAAAPRIAARGRGLEGRYRFVQKSFGVGPEASSSYHFILADLGISSFQLDDPARGLSFFSEAPLDFRMNPEEGPDFASWLAGQSTKELEEILVKYGEELRAKKIAPRLKEISPVFFKSSRAFAEELLRSLHLRVKKNEAHPLTRVYQALRIAINSELKELEHLLEWGPRHLAPGGRLAVITFHSLEDRKVKRAFETWAKRPPEGEFKILTTKALTPSSREVAENPRSRSAKLRVLARGH